MITSDILKSLGAGSGLDVQSIVTALINAKKTSTTDKLSTQEDGINKKISAYGDLKSKLSDLNTSLSDLKDISNFQEYTASVSPAATGVVADAALTSSPVVGSYNLEVTQLAGPQVLTLGNFNSLDAILGTGTITVKFGTTTTGPYVFTQNTDIPNQTLTVDANNNTLAKFRDYINAGNFGFSAATVYNGTNYTLVLTAGNSGVKNSLQITITNDGDSNNTNNAGLSQLTYDANAQRMTQSTAAQDASFKINGVTATNASNTITSALPGVTLSLKNTNANNPVALNISKNNQAVIDKISGFIKSFNAFKSQWNTYTSYNTNSHTAGVLSGNTSAATVNRRINNILTSNITGLSGKYLSMADVGIKVNSADGTLSVDSSKLSAALDADASQVAKLFGVSTAFTNTGVSYESATANTLPGNYAINITQLAANGSDVVGTINGRPATGSGQYLTSTAGDSLGLKIKVTSQTPGDLGRVTFVRGKADQLSNELDNLLNDSGTLESSINAGKNQLKTIDAQITKLNKDMDSYQAKLLKQFNGLDTLITSLKSQSNFITQTLSALSQSNSKNK